jgi:cellulose synthase/poly-beta-1,6-N-acetylglucosamine synthase-like glycosyltransferase
LAKLDYTRLGPPETHGLMYTRPDESAFHTVTVGQRVLLVLAAAACVLYIFVGGFGPGVLHERAILLLVFINFVFTLFYVVHSLYKLLLITLSARSAREIVVSEGEVAALDESTLPVYTILVPLYRETESLAKLVKALEELDYPAGKLDIKLLLEEDDALTVDFANTLELPPQFEKIVVPHSMPKTKPKACNLGLARARGEYLVIFDAEDRPEPDQLKKALIGFTRVPDDVICLQAKLNFYNRNQNILTRWFATEYSTWFDLYLPGLGEIGAPIPLGGTSNHFRTSVLQELSGWDPYNVTEDCDLGMRLYRRRYRTVMLDSTTWEEACSHLGYWIRQRSRWIKGYVQTYLVHMRRPLRLLRQLGLRNFINFQFVIGGNVVPFLLNPIYWLLAALWFGTRMEVLTEIFPTSIFVMGAICLFVGNFSFIYIGMIGAYKRRYYDLVKYGLIILPYWVLMSIGAWKGFIQLIRKPHFWEKTKHGLHLQATGEEIAPTQPAPETSA